VAADRLPDDAPRLQLRLGDELVSVLDVSPLATTVSRLSDGVVLYANPAGSALLGFGDGELVGRRAEDLQLWQRPEDRAALLARLDKGGALHNEQRELRRRDGALRTAITSVQLVDVDGEPAVLSMFYDITERALLEAQISRTSEAALESARSKSEFLTAMSHEIRTPLNGVIGMTGLLLQTDLSPEQRQYAEIARSSGETLLGIVDDILDFSKIEAGRLDLQEVEFDLGDLVADVAELLAPTAAAKGLELVVSIDPATPQRVLGDSVRLRQVLLNLASNATRFTEQGSVVLRARPELDLIRFEVQDTGIGIEPRALSAIFDSFAQADRSTTRRFGGTGLGLAICRRLTTMMGGDIGCRSKVGSGSTFWFTCRLPAAGPAEATPAAPLAGRRLLVVDDLEVSLAVLRAQLEGWGATVRTTSWPAQALGLVEEAVRQGEPYDVVLTDADLRADGDLPLVSALAELPEPRPRLVVLSSFGDTDEQRALLAAAQAAHLTRPVRPSRLQEVLLRLLEGTSPPAATRPAPLQRQGHLLVVDDNATNRIVAEAMLTRRGYTVDLAENGREAVEAVLATRYDAVLMDCEMPVLDGYAAAREIREAEGYARRTRIVALTASAMRGDAEKALAAGMDAHLTKPITLDRLHEELDRLLAATPAVAPPASNQPPPVDEEPLELLLHLDTSGELVRRVVEVFVQDGPGHVQALREAHADADLERVSQASHSLCGMSCAVGAVVVTAECRTIEGLARQGALPSKAAVEELALELDRASQALQSFLGAQLPTRT
jgi:PAS domain S-box-containing protein